MPMLSVVHFKLSANQISRKCYKVEALFHNVKIVTSSLFKMRFCIQDLIIPVSFCH